MKILHFADVHIGMENYGKIDPKTGLNTRFLDFLDSLDQIVKYVYANKPDLILFSGDAYKDRNPSPTQQREFASRIKTMAQISPIVLVVGNHDLPQALEKANTLDIFSALEVENVFVSREAEVLTIQTKSGPIQVLTLPWLTKSKLLEKEKFSNRNQAELQKILAGEISKIVDKEIKKLNFRIPTVVNAHITFEGAVFSSERSVMLGSDLIIPAKIFSKPIFKYVALGHIHKFQILKHNPSIVYSGSIDRIDWGEEKEKKGFVIVKINGKTEVKFVPLQTRNFITINIKLSNEKDPIKEIKKQIKKYKIKNAIVRAKVKIAEDVADQISDFDVRRYLGDANYISSISFEIPETKKIKETKTFEIISSPLETLHEYLQFKKIPPKRQKILEKYAERLFEE